MKSNKKTTKLAEMKAMLEEKKQAFILENNERVEMAKQEAEATKQQAQREANVLIGNSTYQFIYYIHNNIIHQIDRAGTITPFTKHSFGTVDKQQLDLYKNAMKIYNDRMRAYKPYINKWVVEERPNQLFSFLKETHNVLKRIPNPEKRPRPPFPPRSKEKEFNSAVSDIIVDVATNRLIWGRWADPYKIFSMDMDSREVKTLFNCDDMVTSVAIDHRNQHLYWLEGNRFIMRGNLGGGGKTLWLKISAPDKGGLWQMEIDEINNRLYWTNDISLWRADIIPDPAPTSLMVIAPFESTFPIDLAVDGYNGYLYWIDSDLKKLRRSDLEGINVEDLYDIEKPTRGLKVDATANLLYWSDEVDGQHVLRRASTKNPIIRLDGKDDYIEIPHFNPGDRFTVEMWVSPDVTKNGQCFVGKHDNAGGNIFLVGYWTNGLSVTIRNKHNQVLILNKGLFHLSVSVSPVNSTTSKVKIYIDGELKKQFNLAARTGAMAGRNWVIGQDWDNNSKTDFFDGGFQELRIWNKERTAAEIKNYVYHHFTGDENNLIGYWRADTRQGNILPDLSLNGRHGTIIRDNNVTPNLQNALQFDGKSNFVQMPPTTYSFENGLTLEAWVYYDSIIEWGRILDFGNGQSDNFILATYRNTKGLALRIRNQQGGIQGITVPNLIETKKWIHFAVTIDRDKEARIYKNGKLAGKQKVPFFPVTTLRKNNFIGKGNYRPSEMHDGKISEVRIWNRHRTHEEILENMHQRIDATIPGLIGYWPLSEGEGKVMDDRSVNNHNGKLLDQYRDAKNKIKKLEKEASIISEKKKRIEGIKSDFRKLLDKIKRTKNAIKKIENDQKSFVLEVEKAKLELPKLYKEQAEFLDRKRKYKNDLEIIMIRYRLARNQYSQTIFFDIATRERLKKEIEKLKRERKRIEKELSNVSSKLNNITKRINENQKKINNNNNKMQEFKVQMTHQKELFEQFNSLKGDRSLAAYDKEILPLTEKLKKIAAIIKQLSAPFAGIDEPFWVKDNIPINIAIQDDFEIETMLDVPGLDGMALVSVDDYQKAKRKRAYDDLLNTKKQKEAERARAQQLAAQKRKAAEALKLQKEREAAALEAKGIREAKAKRDAATRNKRNVVADNNRKKREAEENKKKKIAAANVQAAQKREAANSYKRIRVAEAEKRKAKAQRDVDRARDEKGRLT